MPAAVPEGQVTDQNPIINDPYAEPTRQWQFGEGAPTIVDGRRLSGYLPPGDTRTGELSITADVVALDLVNDLRARVAQWRADGYPGATAITRDLFDRWFDDDREPGLRPFFAQQEAVETIVFLTEAPPERRVGISVPRTEAYERWGTKMATGTGKTLVMGMLIAWSVLNKAANTQDTRFADAVLVVCPNLTVKERLGELVPTSEGADVYRAFDLVPPNLSPLLGQGRVQVINWHRLAAQTDPKRGVVRLGDESPAAFARRVLDTEGTIGRKRRILVLNDESHHAYRRAADARVRRDEKDDVERATIWIEGLERIHHDREILRCIDLSATPMYVPGSGHDPWTPFEWIVSDFALVDAIEAGLVKVPRIPVDDNAGAAVPKYRNLWEHVKAHLPKTGDDDAGHALTDYLTQIDGPLKQLAGEWKATLERWQAADRPVPPAMIVICNDTTMAEVLDAYIAQKGRVLPELANRDGEPTRTVRIDSKLLADAESRDEAETATAAAERLRHLVGTVGKAGEPGGSVRCLISVQMLSEGWDARNVTQILGLRAFQSQLLCEQVVGRGLRRSSYDDLATPEYVDVYGVPFQMLPFAKGDASTVTPPPRLTSIVALRDRSELEIRFPRVVGIVHDARSTITVDWDSIADLGVKAEHDPTRTTVAGVDGGLGRAEQDREWVWRSFRRQRLCFEVAARVIEGQRDPEVLFPQAIRAVEQFLDTKVVLAPGVEEGELDNELYKTQIVERLRDALRPGVDDGALLPVLDEFQPIGTTAAVAFQTAKQDPEPTVRSHVNYVVCDSELERHIARELEADDRVLAYVKNDHVFLEIPYRFNGKSRRYIPDFVVRLPGERFVLVEGKGRVTPTDEAKEGATQRWVAAVNADSRWGAWSHVVVKAKAEVRPAIDDALAVAVSPVS